MTFGRDHGFLLIAIVCEVIATSALKASAGFTRPLPAIVTVIGYGVTFWCFSLALRTISTGIAYALWSGVGIILISAIGWVWFKQSLDLPAMLGLGLIIAGIVVINLFSTSVSS
jgi:small multidrug resistance pump